MVLEFGSGKNEPSSQLFGEALLDISVSLIIVKSTIKGFCFINEKVEDGWLEWLRLVESDEYGDRCGYHDEGMHLPRIRL